MDNPGKVLISGVGRSGTTFLIRLFTLLDLDTGFDKNDINSHIFEKCNSGMEFGHRAPYRYIKNPGFCEIVDEILQDTKIDYMIIPVRKLDEAAESRVKNGNDCGGLIEPATDKESQLVGFDKMISKLVTDCAINDVPMIFLSFNQMVKSPQYCYDKLKPVFPHNIPFELFCEKYNVASNLSKPKR